MLRAVPMVHLRIQVPNPDAPAATRCVARAGVLHLIDLAHGRIPGLAPPSNAFELLAAFRDLASRIRQLAARIGAPLAEPEGNLEAPGAVDFAEERERLDGELRPLEREVEAFSRRLTDARERLAQAREAAQQAERFQRAGLELERLAAMRFAAVSLVAASDEDLDALAGLLEPAPFAIVPLEPESRQRLAAVAVPSGDKARLASALRVAALQPLALPSGAPPSPDVAQRDEAAALDALAEAKTRALPLLAALLPRAEVCVVLLQAQSMFATSGRFTVLSGWVPAADAEHLRSAIIASTAGRAVVDVDRPEDLPEVERGSLKVPILHRNPLLLRPFMALVRLYGTPEYREVEPTAFFALSFLLMFGLMFGDVGHGATLFLAGWLTFRRLPRFLDYGILLMEGGVASMVFGLLYGSIFGVEDLLPTLWLRPVHDLSRFMMVAAGLGMTLVSFGLVLNVVNQWRAGQRGSALFGISGLFGAFLYWVLLALGLRAFLPGTFVLPGWVLIVLAAIPVALLLLRPLILSRLQKNGRPTPHPEGARWLSALEGSIELVDTLFTFFANTISFVRVAAFAAVHSGIFIALFALADTLARVRFGGALQILVLIAGNAVAILLEGLTVSVQVLRLEYYEFFTRFFRGGGQPYRPLMLRPHKEGT